MKINLYYYIIEVIYGTISEYKPILLPDENNVWCNI
jgi:hypothetical protein